MSDPSDRSDIILLQSHSTMPGWLQLLSVGAGGAIGAIFRFLLQYCLSGSYRQWVIVAVNLTGSALIGAAWAIAGRYGSSVILNQWLIAGVLGGFTTYSTFAWDSFDLIRNGRTPEAVLYMAVTVICGLLLCALAFNCTEKLLR